MFLIKKFNNLINIPRSAYHYKRRHAWLPYLPNALWIEPTNICNLKCIMCPNSIVKQARYGFMDLDLYKRIVDEARDFVSYATLCLSGESLLHKDFPKMVKYAKGNGINVYLSTNSTVLSNDLSRAILEAGLDWINFSFDGCSKEVYESIRVNADFEKTLNNIIGFLKLKKQLKARTMAELQILVMDKAGLIDYEKNIADFLLNFEGLPLDFVQFRNPNTWGGFFANTEKFEFKRLGREFSPCSYLWSSLHILWDGRVVACTSDFFGENTLGVFPKQTLRQVWNGPSMRSFRQAMIDKDYLRFNRNCRDCDSLWEEPILGLPPGIRGISAITVSNVFGKGFLAFSKRAARFFNPDFAMKAAVNKAPTGRSE